MPRLNSFASETLKSHHLAFPSFGKNKKPQRNLDSKPTLGAACSCSALLRVSMAPNAGGPCYFRATEMAFLCRVEGDLVFAFGFGEIESFVCAHDQIQSLFDRRVTGDADTECRL